MSNKDTSAEPEQDDDIEAATANADIEAGVEPDAEHALETDAAASPEPIRSRKSNGAIAWLALFLALIASATVGYSLVNDWRQQRSAEATSSSVASSVASLNSRIESLSEAQSGLERRFAELVDANELTAANLGSLQRDIESRTNLFDSLPPRMATLESTIASLQGVSTGARDRWLIAEAEYYMQIANVQLQLAGNPGLAALALGMADERVVQLASPALTDVRRALSDELAALEVMEKPDIEGVALTLASLARVVQSLPLRTIDASGASTEEEAADEPTGVDRAWQSVKGAVSELVRVTPPDQDAMPLIAPESEQFLRVNLALQLQTARLALLRAEKAIFEQSLDDAAAWITDYFDTESAPVSSALETIREIRDGMFTVVPPDISKSLRLLRQYKALAESTQ